jgi:hypothetical protein
MVSLLSDDVCRKLGMKSILIDLAKIALEQHEVSRLASGYAVVVLVGAGLIAAGGSLTGHWWYCRCAVCAVSMCDVFPTPLPPPHFI